MSNENSDIKIITDIGELEFHDFLIKHQCNPEVLDVKFSKVTPAEGIIDAINNSDAVIIGPSTLGIEVSSLGVASLYESFLDTIVIDKKIIMRLFPVN